MNFDDIKAKTGTNLTETFGLLVVCGPIQERIDAQHTACQGRLQPGPLEQPTCRCEEEGRNSCNCAGPANEPGAVSLPRDLTRI